MQDIMSQIAYANVAKEKKALQEKFRSLKKKFYVMLGHRGNSPIFMKTNSQSILCHEI